SAGRLREAALSRRSDPLRHAPCPAPKDLDPNVITRPATRLRPLHVGRTKMLTGDFRPIYAVDECEINLARRELRIGGSPVILGGRAFEILEVLVQSAGELVTKDALMNGVWPGAVVMENTLQVHIVALRKALWPYRNLLKTESCRGYRLLGSWTLQHREADHLSASSPPSLATEQPRTTNLPAAVEPLVGRYAAEQTLQTLFSAYRLMTLTGPPGIG